MSGQRSPDGWGGLETQTHNIIWTPLSYPDPTQHVRCLLYDAYVSKLNTSHNPVPVGLVYCLIVLHMLFSNDGSIMSRCHLQRELDHRLFLATGDMKSHCYPAPAHLCGHPKGELCIGSGIFGAPSCGHRVWGGRAVVLLCSLCTCTKHM